MQGERQRRDSFREAMHRPAVPCERLDDPAPAACGVRFSGVHPAAVVVQVVQQHQLVIAENGMEPWLVQQPQRVHRVGAPVDEVADRQQPIPPGIESDPVELAFEQAAVTVQVTDHEIAAVAVAGQAKAAGDPGNPRHDARESKYRPCVRRPRPLEASAAMLQRDVNPVRAAS